MVPVHKGQPSPASTSGFCGLKVDLGQVESSLPTFLSLALGPLACCGLGSGFGGGGFTGGGGGAGTPVSHALNHSTNHSCFSPSTAFSQWLACTQVTACSAGTPARIAMQASTVPVLPCAPMQPISTVK